VSARTPEILSMSFWSKKLFLFRHSSSGKKS
jgi:hypothetical protein